MHRYRILSAFVLTAALLAPVATHAAVREDARRAPKVQVRIDDCTHKDYHVWNDHEDHLYRQYLGDRHRSYRGYRDSTARSSARTGTGVTRTANSQQTL